MHRARHLTRYHAPTRKSRRTRDLFTCTSCGHGTHADIGAAINIKHRALEALEQEADRPQLPNTPE
uniref:zinc ribbon domain-containing protein n=1 Tax=Streptomyces doudnae TaxID=3075536 RepID=UPI00374E042E